MTRNWYDSVVPADATPPPRDIDVSVAHPARVYDYWLGGKDNFAADRVAAEQVLEAKPGIRDNVRGQPAVPGPAAPSSGYAVVGRKP